jgi:hypothetical protein
VLLISEDLNAYASIYCKNVNTMKPKSTNLARIDEKPSGLIGKNSGLSN